MADLNDNVRTLSPSATVAINERSNELLAQGREVYKLGLGQSPFPVPDSVVQALADHASEKDYLPIAGLPALRQAVAAYHRRTHDLGVAGHNIVIGPGSKELMFLLQLAHSGELLLPSPSWVSYAPQAQVAGRTVHWLHTRAAHRWSLRAEDLDRLCTEQGPRPRLMILNYPSNPTGCTYSPDQLDALAAVAREHGIVVLSDEIYGELHHNGQHESIATRYPEGTIVSGGLSKWCGAGGWRLGTFAFPDQLDWLQNAVTALASETYTTTSAPIQFAAVRAFEGGPEIDEYLNSARRTLRDLGQWVVSQLKAAGISVEVPDGAFYLFLDFRNTPGIQRRGLTRSRELCAQLLDETGVAILPGNDFGRGADELTARLAYVDFDGAAALDAVARERGTLSEDVLRRLCPRVTTAIDRLCGWAGSA